jgi:hypothetical protein
MSRSFWTSFFDGFTGEGLFGELRIPGFPTRLFKGEEAAPAVFVLRLPKVASTMPAADLVDLRAAIREAIDNASQGRTVEIALSDGSDSSSARHAAS